MLFRGSAPCNGLGVLGLLLLSAPASAEISFTGRLDIKIDVPQFVDLPPGYTPDAEGKISNAFGYSPTGVFGSPLVQLADGKYLITNQTAAAMLGQGGITLGPIGGKSLAPIGNLRMQATGTTRIVFVNITDRVRFTVRVPVTYSWNLQAGAGPASTDGATVSVSFKLRDVATGQVVLQDNGLIANGMQSAPAPVQKFYQFDLPRGSSRELQLEAELTGAASTKTADATGGGGGGGGAGGAGVFRKLVKDTELSSVAKCLPSSPTTYTCKATFKNETPDKLFAQPFLFLLNSATRNVAGTQQPVVSDADLGGDGILMSKEPGETTRELTFVVTHLKQPFAYYVDAYALVIDVQMKLEQDGPIKISTDGKYTEDATIKVTAVRSDTGQALTGFKGNVSIAEDTTTIYAQNTAYGATLPKTVAIQNNGTASFVAKSRAAPLKSGLNGEKPKPAKLTTVNFKVYGGAPLPVEQWVGKPDWADQFVKDLRGRVTGDLKTVFEAVSDFELTNTIDAMGKTLWSGGHGGTFKVQLNPYFGSHRIDYAVDNRCGANSTKAFTNTAMHEARHAYQASLSVAANDKDQDYLLKPGTAGISLDGTLTDSTAQRTVCKTTDYTLKNDKTYKGDDTKDALDDPDWVRWAAEMDCYRYAAANEAK